MCFASFSASADESEAAAGQVEIHVETDATSDASETTPIVGWIELNGMLRESPVPFAWVAESDAGPSLQSLLDQIAAVRDGEEHKGLVLFLDQPELSLTQCTAIADALIELRATGKTVMTFAEAYDLRDYIIASAADMVLLQQKGSVELMGIAVEEMYLAGMLEKIGVKPDLLQVGKYKGADETLMRSEPSEAWDENFDALLDGLYEQSISRIAEGRGMTREEVESLMADSWTLTDQELLARRAVDQVVDRDLIEVTEVSFGEYFEWDTELGLYATTMDTSNPFAMFSVLFAEPTVQTDRPTLAVIHADGPIMSGDSSYGDGLFSEESIGSRTLVYALEDALYDENIMGVVLRLDSPGGSALASEVIWQAVRDVAAEKPVFAVVGSMAASGGYYIVSGADQIYVQPHSILGSIGVVGGKITLGGLYDWAGVSITRRSRGPGGDLFNSVEPFTTEQRVTVRKALQVVYDQFIDRVEIGRGDRLPDVSTVAEGRLFVGTTSIENGMADRLGGLDQALADLAEQIGLDEGEYDVVNLPGPMSLNEYLNSLFGVSSPAVAMDSDLPAFMGAAKQLLGPVAWRNISRSMQGMMLLQDEPVLMMMPTAIVVK
ncbi:S49 family peptidase [Algisphaera agarilytica]|uniref:Protease-4 n=1 Tax=Algisphaera agarilytica TaxID=1385975 RepID=A0A7X0H867_9BACT|nr:S49 family peptidase [Algisphaera agarilytica]MBB6431075.1 protease-4 [Algisphaera agarilytica]